MEIREKMESRLRSATSHPFPLLVFLHLSEEQWYRNGIIATSWEETNPELTSDYEVDMETTHTDARPGPRAGILDDIHYLLLLKSKKCEKMEVKNAWEEWKRLGNYEFGENQRRFMVANVRYYLERCIAVDKVKKAFLGAKEGKRVFLDEMMKERKRAMLKRGEYKGIPIVRMVMGGYWPNLEHRCIEQHHAGLDGFDPDTLLGKEIY
jgi:hypothetical protein